MCRYIDAWSKRSEILTIGECVWFGDLSGQCHYWGSPHRDLACPTKGRRPQEDSENLVEKSVAT